MHPQRRRYGLSGPAGTVLAWVLALLLLVALTFSVSDPLHQSLHNGTPVNHHFCLVCSLVKGQVSVTVLAPILAVVLLLLVGSVPMLRPAPVSGPTKRSDYTRGPPAV